jgi:hypothetical protein
MCTCAAKKQILSHACLLELAIKPNEKPCCVPHGLPLMVWEESCRMHGLEIYF